MLTRRVLVLAGLALVPLAAGCTRVAGAVGDDLHSRLIRAYRKGGDSTADTLAEGKIPGSGTRVEVVEVGTPFLRRWQVAHWTIWSAASHPPWGIDAVGPDDDLIGLRGHPESFSDLLRADGARITTAGAAVEVAEAFAECTRPGMGLHHRVNAVADLPWTAATRADESTRGIVERVEREYATRIVPPVVTLRDDAAEVARFEVTYWETLDQQLVRVVLTVRGDEVAADREVVERGLPLPIGGR